MRFVTAVFIGITTLASFNAFAQAPGYVMPNPPNLPNLPSPPPSPVDWTGAMSVRCEGESVPRDNLNNITQAVVDQFTNDAKGKCLASCNSTSNPEMIAFFETCTAKGGSGSQTPPNCSTAPAGCLLSVAGPVTATVYTMKCFGYTKLYCSGNLNEEPGIGAGPQ